MALLTGIFSHSVVPAVGRGNIKRLDNFARKEAQCIGEQSFVCQIYKECCF